MCGGDSCALAVRGSPKAVRIPGGARTKNPEFPYGADPPTRSRPLALRRAAPRAGSRTRARSRPTRARARRPAGRRSAGSRTARTPLRARRSGGCRALRAVEPEADELLRLHVVAGQGERHEERQPVEREEELAAVRVIVAVPQQHPLGRAAVRLVGARRLIRVREDVMAVDRLVAAVEDVAAPLADEHALRRAAFVARILVHGAPALRGPADDLDPVLVRIVDELSVPGQRCVRRRHDRHAYATQPGGQRGIQVVGSGGHSQGQTLGCGVEGSDPPVVKLSDLPMPGVRPLDARQWLTLPTFDPDLPTRKSRSTPLSACCTVSQ